MGKVADVLAPTHALHTWECLGQLQGVRAAATFKSSHRPDGKMADMPKSTLIYQGSVRASHACKLPIAPMGFSHVLRLCLQGGGVFVESGTVSFVSCTITGNSVTYVRAQLKTSHRRWEDG